MGAKSAMLRAINFSEYSSFKSKRDIRKCLKFLLTVKFEIAEERKIFFVLLTTFLKKKFIALQRCGLHSHAKLNCDAEKA